MEIVNGSASEVQVPRPPAPGTGPQPDRPWAPRSSRRRIGDLRAVLRLDVHTSGELFWTSNDLRFLDEAEALTFARGLTERWLIVDDVRVVSETRPLHEAYLPDDEGSAGRRSGRSAAPVRVVG